MVLKSNIDKWTYYKNSVDAKIIDFLMVKELDMPKVFYEVLRNGELITKHVHGLKYFDQESYLFFRGKKPTTDDVNRIMAVAATFTPTIEGIRVIYDAIGNTYSLIDITERDRLFLVKEQAENLSYVIKRKITHEEELLSTGDYIRCDRCRKVVHNDHVHTETMRNYKMYGHMGKKSYFCSPTCAAHQQMSLEG